ncbi:hypothetical protein TR75_10670 [Hydrogenibacillus schlegelii]|uniref:Uncharacterized protein n=1 Tax=Hydrogenibacillus schlegelii TaxID=1484 RepID=A0A132MGR2_HYDSH|nr:hypothetical protein TR75_10670 [Hydrogenibacillus schlegelii]OAR04496.1 hypothetical protein SA87_10405 [Hydrogenibacillus schlegelii]
MTLSIREECRLPIADFWLALGAIIVIDLVLAGDNALVIALAARELPPGQRRRAVLFGTAAAVVIRALATAGVVYLLRIPLLLAVGGALLIGIGLKLLGGKRKGGDHDAAPDLWSAIRTIALADTVMSLDNVLAVAGAARHDVFLVVLGLLISIPIMIAGSGLILRLIDRFPVLIALGAWVIEWTAFGMIADDPLLRPFFAHPVVHVLWTLVAPTVLVLAALSARRRFARTSR